LPLVEADQSPFDWDKYKNLSVDQLITNRIMPSIKGFYQYDFPSVNAVVLSHAHADHYGLLRYVNEVIPIYMSLGTRIIMEVSNLFSDAQVDISSARIFKMYEPFSVGEFRVIPYLMDHSAPDAAAFLIECDGKRVFYSGDFRGHGRKGVVLNRLIQNPPTDIDYLMLEGSTLGRPDGYYKDEAEIENAFTEKMRANHGPVFIFCSSQNQARLVSVYRASVKTQRTLVIDVYTAFILDKLRELSDRVPQFDWSGVRVCFLHHHAEKVAELDKALLYKYVKTRIKQSEIIANPEQFVILAKENRYYYSLMSKVKEKNPLAIYSMWHGYLERSKLESFLKMNEIPLIEIHTSGHAYENHLKKLYMALQPKQVVDTHFLSEQI
jgi:ribonuclease J